ncbi:exodeoxyribonuclease VII large subunit [Streptomyces caniscabiei]|uniref:exodeoxyribonuclease VII large subunit n=1 Tax=Streptomyces caniscabiei TaxID=2746961 RepID=UPI0029AD74A5|nr:exodeoxyribonuclease VII large subunit [Streptomyces caniscabiei]MDX2776194.1 exodeoxyribonuclease VII large subunit [Streptomyces caniscabiei]
MENDTSIRLGVSDFIALTNQTLEYAYPSVEVEGEIASFKVNQGKYVFFDLKDERGSVGCFMTLWQLRTQVEDGMKVVVTATPKLTPWGKFSLTVRQIRPSGEGSLKKSFELLKAKLEKEGLFAPERKRPLPTLPRRVAVISSTQAAGYADFIKLVNDRWGGLEIDVAHVQVQGAEAPDQIIRALRHFNSQEELPEVIVIVRGGGSADDLSAFNDELLVREIAMSRVPTLVGVGHEVDISLADMAADVRAATPSNAAHILVPDRKEVVRRVRTQVQGLLPRTMHAVDVQRQAVRQKVGIAFGAIEHEYTDTERQLEALRRVLAELDPKKVLDRGYALVRGEAVIGSMIEIEKRDILITAEVTNVSKK